MAGFIQKQEERKKKFTIIIITGASKSVIWQNNWTSTQTSTGIGHGNCSVCHGKTSGIWLSFLSLCKSSVQQSSTYFLLCVFVFCQWSGPAVHNANFLPLIPKKLLFLLIYLFLTIWRFKNMVLFLTGPMSKLTKSTFHFIQGLGSVPFWLGVRKWILYFYFFNK